ncbi:Hypothetical_protein [Hexamita inflata]|uniref:Hypothetical_protein n=1 Tax=Hexamita inflata TaxID=28002 RepID=A0AA86R6W0_9EUKA|nr:Hypothetical protein HINF_LOCUS59315 [Hexamita inflata]
MLMYHERLSAEQIVMFQMCKVQIQKIIYPFAFLYIQTYLPSFTSIYTPQFILSTPNVQQTAGSSRICGEIVHQADKNQSAALKYKAAFVQYTVQEQALVRPPSPHFSVISALNQLQFKASLQTPSTLINRENFLNSKTGNATPKTRTENRNKNLTVQRKLKLHIRPNSSSNGENEAKRRRNQEKGHGFTVGEQEAQIHVVINCKDK